MARHGTAVDVGRAATLEEIPLLGLPHPRRVPAALAGAALLTLTAIVAPATAWATPDACPAIGDVPGLSDRTNLADANVALFVGGDWSVQGHAAESEGVHVVLGDVDFTGTDGLYAVGIVGLGSGIVPPQGSVMLSVGGDVDVVPGLEVRVGDRGVFGEAHVGGVVTGNLTAPQGKVVDGLGDDAVAAWSGLLTSLRTTSAELAGKTPTGRLTSNGYGRAELAGDGTSVPQVFTLTTAELAAHRELHFTGIPAVAPAGFAPVVVNVVGPAATMAHNIVTIDGVQIDNQTTGRGASALLWNFTEATSLDLPHGGQEIGSVLAPFADARVAASTNGRLYVGGDLVSTGEVGSEHHAYPWAGGAGVFTCSPAAVTPPASTPAPTPVVTPTEEAPAGPSAEPITPSTTAPSTTAPSPSTAPLTVVETSPATPPAGAEAAAVVTTEAAGSASPETAQTPDTAAATGRLAHTGADLTALWVSLGLLALGGVIVLGARRIQRR